MGYSRTCVAASHTRRLICDRPLTIAKIQVNSWLQYAELPGLAQVIPSVQVDISLILMVSDRRGWEGNAPQAGLAFSHLC